MRQFHDQTITYSATQKSLHWLIFLLVLLLYALTYGEEFYPRGDPGRDKVWWLHISFGLLLAALVVWRIVTRLAQGAPGLPAEMSRLERGLAKAAHGLLYLLLVVLPVLGIALTWLRGDTLTFFDLFTIPAPIAPDRETARSVKELHELAANLVLIVAGLHAAAALWHHYFRRDDVLRRMLPGSDRE